MLLLLRIVAMPLLLRTVAMPLKARAFYKGIVPINQTGLTLGPLRVITVILNSLSCNSHRAMRPKLAG